MGGGFPGPALRSDPGLGISDRWSFGIGLREMLWLISGLQCVLRGGLLT
jgi:hypothetical protein